MDSGLIFPIIVALWLAYVVPQWIRRRERLSASGSTDRFSTAMRVLARRDERKQLERRPDGPVYVLTPPRRDLGHVVVRRARPVDLAPTRPLAPSTLPNPTTPHPSRDHAELPRRRGTAALAVLLLVLLVSTPALAGLAAVRTVPLAAPVLSLVAAAATLALLRLTAKRRRAARRSTRADVGHSEGVHGPEDAQLAAVVPTPRVPEQAQTAAGMSSARDAADGTWTPVPVPPPTYLLKPAAPRPAAVRTDPVVVQPVPRHVLPDLDLVLERRRASGE